MKTQDEKVYTLKGRGKLKEDKLLVGDFVDIDEKQLVIEKLLPRKNKLVRPPLANVEQALIVVAPMPKPDFLLIDKLLIKFLLSKITPVVVINKLDLCSGVFVDEIVKQYKPICDVEMISALDERMTQTILNPILSGKLSILTGQSAVGKTSILNCLLHGNMAVGELSKAGRGKNTTRHSEIFMLENSGLIADTPGFNALDTEFSPEDVLDCYLEFKPYAKKCKYKNCNHINEKLEDCIVKQKVKDGTLSAPRYERYLKLVEQAKEEGKFE